MDIDEIIEKLKDILSSEFGGKRVFDKDVANTLGLSKESLSHMKKRKAVPVEQIAMFCAKRKVSINWVLFNQEPKSLEEETNKFTRIKYFTNINASAGGGGFNFNDDYDLISIDKVILNSLYRSNSVNSKSIMALNVLGDSMEPTLYDKEIILFDNDNIEFLKGGIFVVSTNSGLFVKRLALKVDGSLELISDNKIYNSEIVSTEELDTIRILGRVVGKVGVV